MIDRRTFVKSAAVLGMGAGMRRVVAKDEATHKNRNESNESKRRKWKTSFVAGLGYRSMKPAQVVQSLNKLGYQGIEWSDKHFDLDNPLPGLREITKLTRDAGMEVSRIMLAEDYVSLNDQQRRERIARTIRVIEAAGECKLATVGTTIGPFPWDSSAPRVGKDISESAAWDQVFEAYEAFSKAAETANVVISSEAVFGMLAHDFYTHYYMMSRLNSPFQKVNYDPSHGILYGNYDVGWVIRQWGDRIVHVHLKDAVGEPVIGKFLFPLLGEGRVDWAAVFEALDDIGYQGYCGVEFESFTYYRNVLKEDPEAAARISLEQIKALAGL